MILWRLNLKPGMRVVESGTGSGSLSVSLAKAVYPTGRLYTYEFNEHRKLIAEQEFWNIGMSDYITCTHRDVLSNGFLLDGKVAENSVDAVFHDLPRPEQAVKHAYKVLKPKGKLCNFSPCIEQVQKVALEMANLGFYDIRTFECLSREIQTQKFYYNTIYENANAQAEEDQNAAGGGGPPEKQFKRKKGENKKKQ